MNKLLVQILVLLIAVRSLGADPAANMAFSLNDLRLTNRAQCAVDSDSPTKSVFLILDGYNAGRVSFAVANQLGQDADALANDGMREFRLSVAGLQNDIFQKLSSGLLPLIPHNTSVKVKSKLTTYQSLVLKCNNDTFCPQLRDYFEKVWTASESVNSEQALAKLKNLDTFDRGMFLTPGKVSSSCFFLKKFSPLQAQLHDTEMNVGQIQSLVEAVQNSTQYLATCNDQNASLNSRHVALQLDIKSDDVFWNKAGYDFWNSYRIYLSWAWRFANSTQKFSPQFHKLFQSINLEESLMLLPNGCKSVTPPACESEELSLNAIRELAKPPGQAPEFDKYVPAGPQKELINKGPRSVNNDLLSTLAYNSAGEWVENFRKNFVDQRWVIKNKLYNATHFFTLLSSAYSPEELVESIKPIVLASNINSAIRDEAAFMCLEWQLAGDKKLDFLTSDIQRVTELEVMLKAQSSFGISLQQQVAYYKKLSQVLSPLCSQLERSRFFNQPDYVTNWNGLEKWAQEMTSKSMSKIEGPFFTPLMPNTGAFVTFGSDRTPLCVNPMDCARKVFKSAVDLYSASSYADAFFQTQRQVQVSSVFNPYSELKACKVYDPWFQTKKTQKVFMADLTSTMLFGWNPLPIYIDVDFTAPRVTSFNTLVKNGHLKFDPNIERGKMQRSLLADFGPLLGAPCAIQISPAADKTFNFYAFNGITVNYCKVNRDQKFEGSNPNEIRSSDPNSSSYCGGCSMSFVGVASSASQSLTGFNPFKFGIYLFRSIHKFLSGYKDKVNVPATYTINIQNVMETHARYNGQIPETCSEALGMGLSCYDNTCASKVAIYAQKIFGVKPHTVFELTATGEGDSSNKSFNIRLPGCNYDVSIDARCSGEKAENFWIDQSSVFVPRACKNSVKVRIR